MLQKKDEIIAGLSKEVIRLCNIAKKHNDTEWDYDYIITQAEYFLKHLKD